MILITYGANTTQSAYPQGCHDEGHLSIMMSQSPEAACGRPWQPINECSKL